MKIIVQQPFSWLFLAFVSLCLMWVRFEGAQVQVTYKNGQFWNESASFTAEKVLSGSLLTLVADFRVLDVFSIYYDSRNRGDQNKYMFIAPYLQRAQNLDPQFFDVYRLAASLLVYDAKMPKEAVDLLQLGTYARPDVWEFPFLAGFIAHDSLKDDQLAFNLMSEVVTREGTPLIVMTLASRFLASTSTTADAILFLKGLLRLVPKDYQIGIQERIKELKEGKPARPALRQ